MSTKSEKAALDELEAMMELNVRIVMNCNGQERSKLLRNVLPGLNEASSSVENTFRAEQRFDDAHVVLREGTGLVRSDHVDRAQGLNDGKVFDEDVSLGHALGDDQKSGGNTERQADREAPD